MDFDTMTDEDYLQHIYYDAESPASFSGIEKLYKSAKSDGKNLSRGQIRKWLQTQKLYTTNRQSIHKFKRQKTIVPFEYYMFDLDSAYLDDYTKSNDEHPYFILLIDDFSKRVYTRPVKKLTGASIKKALESILTETGQLPMILRTDKGTEYVNSVVRAFLKKKGVKHIVTQNSTKAAFAERAIYTIKRRLLQAMVAGKTRRWLELLPKITKSYNASYHRSIGMKPNEVDQGDNAKIWSRMYLPKAQKPKAASKANRKKTYRFSVGDLVKVAAERTKFKRGYDTNFSLENFMIADRSIKQGLESYIIKDMANDVIVGSWYPQELQRVTENKDEKYTIEKVLKKRKYRGKNQLLVKWLGLDKKFNSWIDADSTETFK